MAEAIAAAVVQFTGLTGTAAAVVGAAVQVGVYATAAAITSQNSEKSEQGGLIDLQLNSAAPRQLVVGKRMTGGVLIDWYLAGTNNTKLYLPVYLSEGPCGQVTRVFADGREVWSTPLVHGTRTTIPDFRSGGDRLWLTYYDGRVGQTADATLVALGQGWTSANKMTGCAYVVIECQWDSDNMRSPPSLSFEMEGAKLYDRRLDTTAGGSGSHRIDDPSTWAFSDNPAVALDHYLLGRYWSGARTFGIGLSADEVPYSYFAAQANVCDEDVDLKAGGTQKRYRANGFILASEDYSTVITKLCTAMAARAADFGGRFGVIGVESKTPVLTIDDGDLIAGVQEVYTPKRSWAELVGEVEGRFQDPAQLYQPTPYPNVTDATWEAEDGGEPKLFTLDLEFETDVERAQRLALLKARQERRQATLRGVYPLWTVELERGDWFVRTGTKWGEDGKTFEVIERVLDPATYTVTIVSQEVDAADSAWDENVASDGPPAPIDPTDTLSAVQVPSLTVTPVTIAGLAATIPSLKVAWASVTDPRVNAIFVEVFRTGDDQKVATAYQAIPDDDDEVIVQNGIADDVAYYVRAKFLTPSLSSAWSTSISTTSDDAYAFGSASTVPWSGVTDDNGMRPDNNADVTSANTAAAITGQGALATLSAVGAANLLAGVGKNGLIDTEFRFSETYWTKLTSSGTVALSTATSTNGIRRAVLTGADVTIGQYVQWSSQAQWDAFPIAAGEYAEASAYLGGSNVSQVQIFIDFRDASGANVGYSSLVSDASPSAGSGELSTFERLTVIAQAPANTVKARLIIRGIASSSAPVLNVAKPYFGKANAAQTEPTPWSPGFDGELGANVTETRVAAAIFGQGALALLNSLAYGGAYLSGFGLLSPLNALNFGSTYLLETSGGAQATLANFKTLLGTAAAITSQGALATLAQVNLGASGRVYRDDGTTRLTDALAVTALGTAAAFTGQGALATLSTINSSGLVGAGVIIHTALASSAVRLGTNITRADGATSLTDALAVTSLGTAAAIISQGSLATLSALNASSQIGVGLVLASKLGIGDTSNLIQDPDFLDTAYWTLSAGGAPSGAWTFASTDSEATTDLGVPRALKTPAGTGTTTQYFYTASNVAANYIPVEPGRAYQVTARVRVKSGFTQQAYLQVNWYKQDGTAASTASSNITGADYRTVAAVADTTSTLEGLLTAPADAHYARFNFVARTSTTLSNAGHAYFGPPRMRRAYALGTMMVREDGVTALTDASAVTALGTASAITSQGAFATLNTVNSSALIGAGVVIHTALASTAVRLGTNITRADGSTSLTDALAVTSLGTAASIASQGALATLGQVNLGASGRVYRDDGSTRLTDALAVTSLGTSAAFTGQGALATLSTINSSGLIGSGVVTFSALASTAVRLGTNITRADGSTSLTDALAVTSLGTAAAISGQGSLATISRANVVSLSGSEAINNAILTPQIDSLQSTVMPDRVAVAEDFTSSHGATGTPATFAAIAVGSVANVANEGSVRLFTDLQTFSTRGWLPVRSDKTYRITVRAAVTVDGTDNRTYAAFSLHAADGTWLATANFTTLENLHTVADGWITRTVNVTGATLLSAAATAAWVRPRISVNRNASSTDSGSETQVSIVKLEMLTRLNDGSLVREDGSTALTDANVVTSLGTASAITGQGGLATKSAVDLATSEVTNKSLTAVDLAAATKLGTIETNADVTADNTAAAITSQGSLATLSFATLGTNVRLADGTTSATNALLVTSLGTASGISGQGALATLSSVTGARLAAGVGRNALIDPEFRFSSTYWSALTSAGSVALTTAASSNGIRRAVLTGTGVTVGQYLQLASTPQIDSFPIAAGEWLEASVYLGGSNISQVQLFIEWRNASNTTVSFSTAVTDASPTAGNGDLSTFERLTTILQAPANTVKARMFVRGIASTTSPVLNVAKPFMAKAQAGQTEATPWNPGFDGEPGANVTETRTAAAIASQGGLATLSFVTISTNLRLADGTTVATTAMVVTASGTAAGIASQGNQATANAARGNTASRPATTGGWGWYSNTETGTLQLDVDGTGWVDVASLSTPLTVSRTNGFVKTKIGAGTNTSDSVTFTGAGGSGAGYTFAHELIVTYTTGPTPTVSSASGSPITVSATGGVAGDEARGFVVTIVTDSLGAKAQLISPVALFWET